MTHSTSPSPSPNSIPILLVLLILVTGSRTLLAPDAQFGPIDLLLGAISVGIVLRLLVLMRDAKVVEPKVDEPKVDESALHRRWLEDMKPYFRHAAEAEARTAVRRQRDKDLRAAAAERDRGKYGMRKHGSSSPFPEDVPLSKPTTPTRGRFAAESHPVALPGSDPSSS